MRAAERREVAIKRIRFGLVGFLGLVALVQGWTESRRPYPSQLTGGANLRVTSSEDRGMGTLREAILAADRAGSRARVEVLVQRIVLTGPLPPLINPKGVTIEGASGEFAIDAARVVTGAVLEIRANSVVIRNMRIENAPHTAIMDAAQGARIEKSSFAFCETGIETAEGSSDLMVDNSLFERNKVGIRANSFERGMTVQNSKFLSQGDAGIWTVARLLAATGLPLDIGRNQFSDNRFGVVVANHRVQIHDNDIALSREAGIQLLGEGAVIQHNTISDGAAAGIVAESTTGAVISENEIHSNKTVAIMIKDSRDGSIRHNTIYSNGIGIAFVYGHSENPIVATQNVMFSQVGEPIAIVGDTPILKDNVLRANGAATMPGQTAAVLPATEDKSAEPMRNGAKERREP